MRLRRNLIAVVVLGLFLVPIAHAASPAPAPAAQPASAPAQWRVDPARSSIRFSATQAGATFEGRFARFDARIRFDPRSPATGQAVVAIDVASVDTRNGERDTALKTAEWFDPSRFPKAEFRTRRIAAAGNGFVADALLRIRDSTKPVRFTFTVTEAGGVKTLQGQARLSRLAFGLGAKEFANTEWVGDSVTVDVTIVAR